MVTYLIETETHRYSKRVRQRETDRQTDRHRDRQRKVKLLLETVKVMTYRISENSAPPPMF